MATALYLTSDLQGNDSLTGNLTLDSLSLSGSFQGNGLMTGSGDLILEPLIGEGSFQGNGTFIGAGEGTFDPTPIPGNGTFQGNGSFIGTGTIINPDPLSLSGDFFGNGLFVGDGELIGLPPTPDISVFMSAFLEGDDNVTFDGQVVDVIVEPPVISGPCDVTYDIEICHFDFING